MMGIITAEPTENPEPQPLVPWWSFSKTILAAAALVLVDRRKLGLDEPVAGAPYTLRHLLQHTSGLPDYGPNPDYLRAVAAGESPWTTDELLRRVNAGTLLFASGTSFSYSNIGYLLTPATKSAMLSPRSYDADADAPGDFGYGLGLMIEPVRPGEHFRGHAGSGPGSTITVFSALTKKLTFAASVGTDAPDTLPETDRISQNTRLALTTGGWNLSRK